MSTLMAFDCKRCGKNYTGNWHFSADYKQKLPDIDICHGCRDADRQNKVQTLKAEFTLLTEGNLLMMLMVEVAVLRSRLSQDNDVDVHYWKAVVALAKEMRHGETHPAPDRTEGQEHQSQTDHGQG